MRSIWIIRLKCAKLSLITGAAEKRGRGTDKKAVFYHLLAFFTICVWGATFVSSKILLQWLTPLQIMLCRYILGYLALWIFHPKFHRSPGLGQELLCLGAALCGCTLYFLAENYALTLTQASNASLLVSAAPILTSAAAHLFTREEKFSRGSAYGFAAAMAGIFLVVYNGRFVLKLSPAGDLLALCAALLWALYSILLRKITSPHPPIDTTRRIFFYALVTMFPLAFLLHTPPFPFEALKKPAVWGNLIFLGLLASAACYVLWHHVINFMGAVKANNYVYLNPLVTMIVSILVLGERVTPLMLGGAALILLGVMLAEGALPKRKKE